MHLAYWMILLAAVLPYVMAGLAKGGGGVDNAQPRVGLEQLQGWRKRADWAQRNHFEAFPAFAASVFVAELAHAGQHAIDVLAGLFILFRIGYSVGYIAGRPAVRSSCWLGGVVCVVALFCIGA
ncbi:MAPEG family protein [Lichenicola sp.]|uniref:MAPEG family protein n=1 Tax=Lichenicola sp. TaxID=2804529 RepID=UPI003AFFD10B